MAALIVEQMSRRRRVDFGGAVSHFARGREAALVVGSGIVEIGQDDEILAAIAVVIEERGSGTPLSGQNDGGVFGGDVPKRTIAEVAVEGVSAIAGDEDVDAAVVVEISGCNSHSVTGVVETGLSGDVGELQPAGGNQFVAVQAAAAAGLEIVEGRSVQQQNIEIAITIVVEQG